MGVSTRAADKTAIRSAHARRAAGGASEGGAAGAGSETAIRPPNIRM
jgi:hypothetical protein